MRIITKDDVHRKSATFAFRCDRESVTSTAAISFVGADPDECNYMFVVRSQHACAGVEPHKPGSVGPGGVFAIIMIIAIIVYFLGGVFYQRNVANARGWRQLPNYTFWAGIWSFVSVRARYLFFFFWYPHGAAETTRTNMTMLGLLCHYHVFVCQISPEP